MDEKTVLVSDVPGHSVEPERPAGWLGKAARVVCAAAAACALCVSYGLLAGRFRIKSTNNASIHAFRACAGGNLCARTVGLARSNASAGGRGGQRAAQCQPSGCPRAH